MAHRLKRPLSVLVLMHESLVPPDDPATLTPAETHEMQTEVDVVLGLRALGHDVRTLGVHDELQPLRAALQAAERPDIVFNLLEEFHGEPLYDQNVVSYLELMRMPYTGCNPRGLVLARDKALSKKILHYHRIPVPKFAVIPLGRRPRRPKSLGFPLIVKTLGDDASLGISQASVVHADEKLVERVRFIHERYGADAIVEQYIEGRELYVAMLGNQRLKALPTWELLIDKLPSNAVPIATRRVKWDAKMQERWQVFIGEAENLGPDLERRLERTSKRIYRLLGLSGYARIDYRLTSSGELCFLEANPNPDVAREAEFPSSAESAGWSYEETLDRILRIGLLRRFPRV